MIKPDITRAIFKDDIDSIYLNDATDYVIYGYGSLKDRLKEILLDMYNMALPKAEDIRQEGFEAGIQAVHDNPDEYDMYDEEMVDAAILHSNNEIISKVREFADRL